MDEDTKKEIDDLKRKMDDLENELRDLEDEFGNHKHENSDGYASRNY